jgi:quinohemoprotein ethanol dehydrogenase
MLQLKISVFAIVMLCACKTDRHGTSEQIENSAISIDDQRLINADSTPGDWLSNGRNYAETRYSELEQINKNNIKKLGLAWSYNLETNKGVEATPLVVGGKMYVTGPWSVVFALDAVTGKLIWKYDPLVPRKYLRIACCDVVNRGVALYKGKVYVGSLDGRLIALDVETGKPAWQVLTLDTAKPYSVTGAPRVVDGKVIIGNGGAELGVRGYITAYDAETGKQAWRFYTVPGDPSKPFESEAMQTAVKTWNGDWWKYGGGGTVWDAMAYDPDLKLLYIGTGNGSPWNRMYRSPDGGDNLYLSSIVAIDPSNGKMKWYFQTTPGETWDFTATQPLVLADLMIRGEMRKVIMQAPKNGIFYVIDRTNGKFISGRPYTFINWATGIDTVTGRPIETDFSRYTKSNSEIFPGPLGAHNWQPMAFNLKTGLMYFPVRDLSMMYGNNKIWKYNEVSVFASGLGWNTGIGLDESVATRAEPNPPKFAERLVAWDPINQKVVWSYDHKGLWNGGVLTTSAGLVFEGSADGRLIAFDATDGKLLWEKDLGTGIMAAPVTYKVGDTQYVSVAVGWGGAMGKSLKFTEQVNPGTVYTFALNRSSSMPAYAKSVQKQRISMPLTGTDKQVQHGELLYDQYCSICHGEVISHGGNIPGLTYSTEATHKLFKKILLEGILSEKGMPDFSARLSEDDAGDIQHFIFYSAAEASKTIERR